MEILKSHPVPYPAFVNAGKFKILSLSPELFLEKIGDELKTFPMKGTAKRAFMPEDDFKRAKELSKDEKNRAENVMIVDMVRNDFGRICVPGTIKASPLFKVDTYATLHQMISQVKGQLTKGRGICDILKATFPSSSITGAPKVKTMELIRDYEKSERGVYTGAIGCFMPSGDFCLNVAIRTITCGNDCSYAGIGSGIVADSNPSEEWEECLLKKEFINFRSPPFEVLETLLWARNRGFVFLEEHLKRARNSQKYFLRKWKISEVMNCLDDMESTFPSKIRYARVRLLISENGKASAEFSEIKKRGWGKKLLKVVLCKEKIDSRNVFFHHKTTNRNFYDGKFKEALAQGYDEIIFMNRNGEITEGAISNIFIKLDGRWITPPLECGLLNGIWRGKMIVKLRAMEKVILEKDLNEASSIMLGNSVRGGAELERPIFRVF
jgi:para-aminobenzoate synthetase/4-amino-4-deoxychorismate lyase